MDHHIEPRPMLEVKLQLECMAVRKQQGYTSVSPVMPCDVFEVSLGFVEDIRPMLETAAVRLVVSQEQAQAFKVGHTYDVTVRL